MNRRILIVMILILPLVCRMSLAQDGSSKQRNRERISYVFRVVMCDKQNSPYSISHPNRFLSRRSIERRRKQGIAVDSTDLPVSPRYLRTLENRNVSVIGQSRWNNTALVRMTDTTYAERIRQLPFVSACRMVWQTPDSITQQNFKVKVNERFNEWDSVATTIYGRADAQIRTVNGHRLHDIGCRGEGMWIAVLDGGFKNADKIPSLRHADIRGTHDFVTPDRENFYQGIDHGTKVLSTMAAYTPHYYVGTAPKATFWLLRCEDPASEQEIEEDYWAMAAEYADSVGCDVLSSSLGYYDFDRGRGSHKLWQLDGHSTLISHTASLVADKGMILVNSAGNTGMGPWKKISFPADAHNCLTVGAVTDELTNAPFSSVGPTQDGRMKPDVMAIGSPATVINSRGAISQDMGTSFSTPIVSGLVACLWQAMPRKTATEIIQLVRESGNNREHLNNIYGYGVPNFWRAYMVGKAEH